MVMKKICMMSLLLMMVVSVGAYGCMVQGYY